METTMDMSVTVGAATATEKTEKSGPGPRAPNSSDLDAWLEKVEALGELKRISAQVDPDLEAATITYLVGSEKSPALLFENIKGHPGHRALYNMIGCNLSRFCLMTSISGSSRRSACGRSTGACISAPAMRWSPGIRRAGASTSAPIA
jgi:hypothetical protein